MNEAQQIMGALTFPLDKAITAHGQEVRELVLQRPTPAQARQIGHLPYVLAEDGKATPLPEVAAKYIALCAGIPPSSVDQLELADFNALCWAVAGFFLTPASKASAS